MPTLEPVPADHPDLARLTAEVVAEYGVRYDEPDQDMAPVSPDAHWLLVRDDDGTPVGCGAVQPWAVTVPEAPPSVGELKRMYVVPSARGRGLSRLLLEALVESAYDSGLDRLVLETGTEQPEALGLYASSGFQPMPVWGPYADDARTRCFRLDLAGRDGVRGSDR